jgi:hypothetical protein
MVGRSMLFVISSAISLTDVQRTQFVKKVILSVDMLDFFTNGATPISMPTQWGRGIKKQLCPFAGIIQIKFERYDLRTSSQRPILPS